MVVYKVCIFLPATQQTPMPFLLPGTGAKPLPPKPELPTAGAVDESQISWSCTRPWCACRVCMLREAESNGVECLMMGSSFKCKSFHVLCALQAKRNMATIQQSMIIYDNLWQGHVYNRPYTSSLDFSKNLPPPTVQHCTGRIVIGAQGLECVKPRGTIFTVGMSGMV